MRAVVVERGETQPHLKELPRPEPADDEILVRIHRVGIDGTDHEVLSGGHGGFPEDGDYMVLGHEAVGVVEDANGADLKEGQVVTLTVRRPPDGMNEYFERGEPDMAPPDACVERGIAGAHGYMADYVTTRPEYVVPLPDQFSDVGFLVEPLSNAEKALDLAFAARSSFEWAPESAIVLGNGPLGLLTLAALPQRGFERTYCLGRRDRPDPTIDVIEDLGATYVDSRETPVDSLPSAHEPMDLVFEATGYARHAFDTIDALAPNGVGALLGIPGNWTFEVDGARLHRDFVLSNKALVGSVNSHVRHFEAASDTLSGFPDWFTDALVTNIYTPTAVADAFKTGDDRIKTVIEFA